MFPYKRLEVRVRSVRSMAIIGALLLGLANSARAVSTITSITMNPTNPVAGQVVNVTVNYCAQAGYTPYVLLAIVPQSVSPTIETCPNANETFVVYGGYTNASKTVVTSPVNNGLPPDTTDALVTGYTLPMGGGTGATPAAAGSDTETNIELVFYGIMTIYQRYPPRPAAAKAQ